MGLHHFLIFGHEPWKQRLKILVSELGSLMFVTILSCNEQTQSSYAREVDSLSVYSAHGRGDQSNLATLLEKPVKNGYFPVSA